MFDVVFYEAFEEEKSLLKKFLPKKVRAKFYAGTIQEHARRIPPARLICVRTQSSIPKKWFDAIDAILTRSEGVDHLELLPIPAGKKITLGHLEGYCARAVAEHAFTLSAALLKKLNKQARHFKTFNREGLTTAQIQGKRALIVGVGKVGTEIVKIARAMGMDVKGVDIYRHMKNVAYVNLSSGIRWADIIFCAAALTPKTKAMLNYKTLKNAKPGLVLINISRGEITPTAGLKRLLAENVLGGLGMDVFENEKDFAVLLRQKRIKDKAAKDVLMLSEDDRVIFTPHNAFNSHEALVEKCRQTAASIDHYLKHGKFLHTIN